MSETIAEPGKWHPIETAPKDGSKILAYSVRNERADILHWIEASGGYEDHFESALGYGGIPVPYLTHWMPLPPAPEPQP